MASMAKRGFRDVPRGASPSGAFSAQDLTINEIQKLIMRYQTLVTPVPGTIV